MVQQRHNREGVVQAALDLLDEEGIEKVTLRGVAKRLDAHLNTVSYQVRTKAHLFELMADAVLGDLDLDGLPDAPRQRVHALAAGLRAVMLSRRDGARLVAGTDAFQANTLRAADILAAATLQLAADEATAARSVWSIHYLVLGLTLEEQAGRSGMPPGGRLVFSEQDYPSLHRLGARAVNEPFEERLRFGVEAVITAAAAHGG
ncbi:TetR/AcrR family transcriptional regulator C-terminal domain-containing protein [Streptomonospora arabica]|uniref:TetR/AcrR family transcriptional regulator C-terminal domain-containing protein n=1 Tax=Streptomonospora arabica TaxID=412417 RepID=A0ABV9SKY1_9ACTN